MWQRRSLEVKSWWRVAVRMHSQLTVVITHLPSLSNQNTKANFKKKANGLAAQYNVAQVSCPTSQPVHPANVVPAHLCTAVIALLRLHAPRVTRIPTSEQHLTFMHHLLHHHASYITPSTMHDVSHVVPRSQSPT